MINCPSCQTQVPPTSTVCPTCGWKFNAGGGKPGPTIVRPATRPKIQCEVDLYATIDRTGSSDRFRTGIPQTYGTIVSQIKAKARTVKCWVASHGDRDEGQEVILHTDAGTPEQAIEDIRKINYGGGGDAPEHHLDAIEEAIARVPWTADPSRARGAILAFVTADAKPARSGATAAQNGQREKDRGLLLYVVCEPTPTLQEMVMAAGGLMFQITNSPDPTELQKIAAQLAASIVATVASGSTLPMTVPVQ